MKSWLTYPLLQSIVSGVITSSYVANGTFSASVDNTANAVGKCADIVILNGIFEDEFPELDGGERPYGSFIEEFRAAPARGFAVSRSGAGSGEYAPIDIVYSKPAYDYVIDEYEFPVSMRGNDFQAVSTNAEKFAEFVANNSWSVAAGITLQKVNYKREMLGILAAACNTIMGTSTAWATSTAYNQGDYVLENSKVYVCVQGHTSGTFATDLANGLWVEEHLKTSIAKPVDTSTGEAFIKAAKACVHDAMHVDTDGNSLNGLMLGRVPTETLYLYILDDAKDSIDVDTLAGAFHEDRLAVNVVIKPVHSFGSQAPAGMYAMLVDTQGVKLCPHVQYTMESRLARSGWITISTHYQPIPFVSRNTYAHIFVAP